MEEKYLNSVKIFSPKYSREELIEYLKDRVIDLKKRVNVKLVVLFGSYAKGRYTAASDVDLLIVHDDEKDVYSITWDVITLNNLQLFVYSVQEYRKLKKRTNFIETILKEGITIYRAKDFNP